MVSLIIHLEHNQADKHTDIGSMIAQACLHVEFLKLIYFWSTIKRCLGTIPPSVMKLLDSNIPCAHWRLITLVK
ncbi:hypothetical protein CICLE_v10033247mg [Citrus x clementina]|uniref:Uncharacterized protein n=1 Tax=Citrus clementina TaxID=85681 RepID=V4TKS1_CITCL|nr:hypothetical protein CICLE_v10033247mg [Citrus x clementina]